MSLFGGSGSGKERENHKYLARLKTAGGNFRYIYDQAELKAAQAAKTASNAAGQVANQTSNLLNRARTAANSAANTASSYAKTASNAANQAANQTSNLLNRARTAANSAANTAANQTGNLLNRAKTAANSAANTASSYAKSAGSATQKQYNKMRQNLENAKSTMSQQADTMRSNINNAVNTAKSTVNSTVNNASNWIDKNVTGTTAKSKMTNAAKAAEKERDMSNMWRNSAWADMNAMANDLTDVKDEASKRNRTAMRKAYKSAETYANQASEGLTKSKDYANEAKKRKQEYRSAKKEYQQSLAGKAEKIQDDINERVNSLKRGKAQKNMSNNGDNMYGNMGSGAGTIDSRKQSARRRDTLKKLGNLGYKYTTQK